MLNGLKKLIIYLVTTIKREILEYESMLWKTVLLLLIDPYFFIYLFFITIQSINILNNIFFKYVSEQIRVMVPFRTTWMW
jgi:hypothetical protein